MLRLILHNLRSLHNVGQILRTADGAGVESIIMTGFTPYPRQPNDARPAYVIDSAMLGLAKTALGAELSMATSHFESLAEAIDHQHKHHYEVVACEQAENARNLLDMRLGGPTALVFGNEVDGLDPDELAQVDQIWQIPMHGHKESLNVAAAAAVACYTLIRSQDR